MTKKCIACGKLYEPRKRSSEREKTQKFCSRHCYDLYRSSNAGKNRIRIECAKCKKVFFRWPSQINENNINYCSRRCANSSNYHKKNEYPPKVEAHCLNCDKIFYIYPYRQRKAKFCSMNCYFEYKRGDESNSHAKDVAYRHFPLSCAICGFDVATNVHHIKSLSDGGNNSLNNLIILCPNHHAMAHLNLIPEEKLIRLNRDLVAQK